MQWSVVLLSLFCSCFAERPSRHAIAKLEPHVEGTDGSQRISDEDGKPPCAQEASLRLVLKGLGVPDDQLQNVRSFRGVEWKGCDVTEIDLPRRDLHGSLAKEFREFRALEKLDLDDTNITGNLDVLKENTALTDLNLHNTRISGDLQSLAKATKLERLNLQGTQVSGDVAALSNAKGLLALRLSKTQVYGDLVALSNAKGLENLHLSETKVHGDVAALKNAKGLYSLDLSETKVYGDLVALSNTMNLHHLCLSETKVYGDLASLENFTWLETLNLRSTPKVSGDFSVILQWKWITHLDLSGTKVTSHPTEKWQHCCKNLKTLDLRRTMVHIVDGFLANFEPFDTGFPPNCPFPALRALDMTGTSLNTTVEKLLRPFVGCKELRTFKAVECSLTGPMPVCKEWIVAQQVYPFVFCIDHWPLSQVLQLLDLSSNNVTKVKALPHNCRAVSFRGNPQISFGEDVVKEATEHFVSLDLRNATFTHPTEVADLFDSSVINRNRARTVINEEHGFECYDLDSTSIQITPETFAPDRLCSCSPGWKGSGAECKKCPENSFAENYDSKECEQCPQGSKAPAGSTSHTSCICNVGVLDNRTGQWRCGCREHEAFLDETCVKCSDFHLSCPSHGTHVFSAQPLKGYTRLKNETHAFKCLKPDIRCDAEHVDSDVATHNGSTLGACREGYTDVMCMDCAPKYFSSGNQCERCHDSTLSSTGAPIMVAAIVVILVAMGVGIWLWMHRNRHAEVRQGPSASGALKEQLRAQVPILLQLCQLWPVLAVLATKIGNGGPEQDKDTIQEHKEGNEEVGFASAFWEVPYVQALQLSISSLKGAFNLQCKFDGAMVRFISALVAPVVPLTVMLCCMLLELLKPGSGINAGLQALTLLYIGGASSTSNLLSCQEVDGAGDSLPRQFAFRTAMPYILCHEDSQLKHSVDTLAFSSAFFYGIIIPCCLLYLYGRQHVLFQSNRTTVAIVADHGSLKVSVYKVLESTVQKTGNVEFTRRLVAAAAASISVLCRGKVSLRVVDGSALIELLDGSVNAASDHLEPDLLSFIDAEDAKQQAKQQKCWSLCEMLTERSILQDVAPSDRVISGAKTLLLKYALCRSIWMEIVQKLVAVFLVSVVASANGLQLSVAITLTMAATSAMVQPYARPQVNRLHCCSFICLAMAAASFANTWVWTSRAALAIPFLLTAAQAFRPDSLENLAIRLWEELEPQIEALQRGEPVEVTSETYNFF